MKPYEKVLKLSTQIPLLSLLEGHLQLVFGVGKAGGTNPNNSPDLPVTLLNPKCRIFLQVHNWAFLSIRLGVWAFKYPVF